MRLIRDARKGLVKVITNLTLESHCATINAILLTLKDVNSVAVRNGTQTHF